MLPASRAVGSAVRPPGLRRANVTEGRIPLRSTRCATRRAPREVTALMPVVATGTIGGPTRASFINGDRAVGVGRGGAQHNPTAEDCGTLDAHRSAVRASPGRGSHALPADRLVARTNPRRNHRVVQRAQVEGLRVCQADRSRRLAGAEPVSCARDGCPSGEPCSQLRMGSITCEVNRVKGQRGLGVFRDAIFREVRHRTRSRRRMGRCETGSRGRATGNAPAERSESRRG